MGTSPVVKPLKPRRSIEWWDEFYIAFTLVYGDTERINDLHDFILHRYEQKPTGPWKYSYSRAEFRAARERAVKAE